MGESSKIETRFSETYVVEARRPDQDETEWLQEQFDRNFNYVRNRTSRLAAGYGQFYDLSYDDIINPLGITYQLSVHDIHRQTYITIKFADYQDVTQRYVDLYLPNTRKYDNKDGDMIEVFLAGPSTNKLAFRFYQEDGTLITEVNATKQTDSRIRVLFTSYQELWYL